LISFAGAEALNLQELENNEPFELVFCGIYDGFTVLEVGDNDVMTRPIDIDKEMAEATGGTPIERFRNTIDLDRLNEKLDRLKNETVTLMNEDIVNLKGAMREIRYWMLWDPDQVPKEPMVDIRMTGQKLKQRGF